MTSDDVTRELTAQLCQRAAAAQPQAYAWDRFVVARARQRGVDTTTGLPADHGEPADRATTTEPLTFDLEPPGEGRGMGRWWLYGAAAAAVAALVAVGVVAARSDDDGPVPPVTAATTTTAPADPATTEALAVMDRYFDFFAARDLEAVMSLFTSDATFVSDFDQRTRTDFETSTAWDFGQGAVAVARQCARAPSAAPDEVTCTYGDQQHLREAVGAPPVDVTLKATVTPDGITSIDIEYEGGSGAYSDVNNPFYRWMLATHPEDAAAADCCGGSTVDIARQRGELRARYADEWARYLEANGCTYSTYDDACPAGSTGTTGGSTDALRPLAELQAEDVIVPTVVPEGWALSPPTRVERAGPFPGIWLTLTGPQQGSSPASRGEIVVSLERGSKAAPSKAASVELAGLSWAVDGTTWEAWIGPDRLLVMFEDDRALIEELINGLRAGPASAFPGPIVEFHGDGTLTARHGTTTAEGQLVATNGSLQMSALAFDGWHCWSVTGSARTTGCSPTLQGVNRTFSTVQDGDARTILFVGTTAGDADDVTVRVLDQTIVVPTTVATDLIDGRFFVLLVDGELYDRVEAAGEISMSFVE